MDIFPVVCALLGFLLIGHSDAKVVTLQLGSARKGERSNFNATCIGPCKGVNVTVTTLSGFSRLYGKKGSLPHPGDCDDCFCTIDDVCQNISFQGSSSFAISVVADTDFENATLMVEASNLDQTTKITLPSKRLNLGSAKKGKKRNFKVTCDGPCKQVSAIVRGRSGRILLHGAENSVPLLDDDSRCKDCFCVSKIPWWINLCQYKSLEHDSFTLSVTAETDYKNAFLMVEIINFKNIEEILSPSRVLDLSSAIKGERKNFYITCDGPCREVNVFAVSGNPRVFLAEQFMPFLERSRCQNCFNAVNSVSFKDSSSFGLSVLTATSSDIVRVEAANLEDIRERIYPSKTVDGGYIGYNREKTFHFACYGSCKELRVEVTSTINQYWCYWYVAKQYPIARWTGDCSNCFCKKHGRTTCDFVSPDDTSTFVVRVRGFYDPLANVKVNVGAFNLVV